MRSHNKQCALCLGFSVFVGLCKLEDCWRSCDKKIDNSQQTRAMNTQFAKAKGRLSDNQMNDIYKPSTKVWLRSFIYFSSASAGRRVITQSVWKHPKAPQWAAF